MASAVGAMCSASTRRRPSASAGIVRACSANSLPNSTGSREADHPKAACALLASRRYGRYLATDYLGRPRLDPAKVKAAAKFDGKFAVITNDDTLSAEDVALGYKGAWIIESSAG